ncbi:MAG: FtsW/RodA/SpoVE family cell cycle protein [Prevotella sp.]|nr:FtsW/RodA/SpoVE family cell cycle protein [Prevotella sp.]
MINKTLNNLFKGDKVIWMVFFFLCIISVVEVYSASSTLTYKQGSYFSPIIKHFVTLILGIVVMLVVMNIRVQYFKIVTPFLLIFSIVTLIWVLFAGEVNGASRWVSLMGIKFQPSEIAKGTMVLATAQLLAHMQTPNGADRNAFKYILTVCALIVPLILVENFSTAALICAVIFMMMIIGRVPMQQLGKLLGVVMVVIALFVGLILMAPDEKPKPQAETASTEVVVKVEERNAVEKIFHRFSTWKARLLDFFDSEEVAPEEFDLDKDMQKGHSNIAIASSNFIGKGPGRSEERDFLPQAFSDFIYSIIIEELGIIGGFFVLLLYIILLIRTGRIAGRCEKNFPAFLAMGMALLLVTQAMFNMCVAVGLAPVTGQPLPLISKGGTSTVINCVYIGVILSVSIWATKKKTAEPALQKVKMTVEN